VTACAAVTLYSGTVAAGDEAALTPP